MIKNLCLVDTKLLDVKIRDLPAWFGRREKTLKAMYSEFQRNVARICHLYLSPVYENAVVFMIDNESFVFSFIR